MSCTALFGNFIEIEITDQPMIYINMNTIMNILFQKALSSVNILLLFIIYIVNIILILLYL